MRPEASSSPHMHIGGSGRLSTGLLLTKGALSGDLSILTETGQLTLHTLQHNSICRALQTPLQALQALVRFMQGVMHFQRSRHCCSNLHMLTAILLHDTLDLISMYKYSWSCQMQCLLPLSQLASSIAASALVSACMCVSGGQSMCACCRFGSYPLAIA